MSEEKKYPVKQSAAFASSAFVTMGLVDVLAHLGPTGLLVGGIASYVAWKHGPELYEQARGIIPLPERVLPARRGRSMLDLALGRYPEEPAQEAQQEQEMASFAESPTPGDESAAFVSASTQTEAPGVPRITVEQIARHTERNSYEVFIGRSMSRPNNPAISIWRIIPTMYDQRLAHHREILEALRVKYGALLYGQPVRATTKYKDAVTSQTDISDLDSRQGLYWDELATVLIREVGEVQ